MELAIDICVVSSLSFVFFSLDSWIFCFLALQTSALILLIPHCVDPCKSSSCHIWFYCHPLQQHHHCWYCCGKEVSSVLWADLVLEGNIGWRIAPLHLTLPLTLLMVGVESWQIISVIILPPPILSLLTPLVSLLVWLLLAVVSLQQIGFGNGSNFESSFGIRSGFGNGFGFGKRFWKIFSMFVNGLWIGLFHQNTFWDFFLCHTLV